MFRRSNTRVIPFFHLMEGFHAKSTVAAISLDLTFAPYKASAAMPLRNVLAVPILNLQTFDSAPSSSLCRQYLRSKHVLFPYLKQSLVDLLNGSDQFDLIHGRTVIRRPPNTPCTKSIKLLPVVWHFRQQLPKKSQEFDLDMTASSSQFKSGCTLIVLASRVTTRVCLPKISKFFLSWRKHQTCWGALRNRPPLEEPCLFA